MSTPLTPQHRHRAQAQDWTTLFKSLKLKRAARRHGMTVAEYRDALAESNKRHARKWQLRASGLGNW